MLKIMLVGPVGAGKTTLIHAIKQDGETARKTQSIEFYDGAIDTPGEYAQIPRYYSALMVTATEVGLIAVIQDATNLAVTLPPGFASMFSRKVIGVVTKVDKAAAEREKAKMRLVEAGVPSPIFFVSAYTGEGLEEIISYISDYQKV